MVERGRVLPSLPERPRQIPDRRAVDLQLDVVPRRSWSVAGIELDRLLVTLMRLVVPPAVAEIDAAGEGDILIRRVRMAGDEQLLVMAAVAAHPLVEQHLTAGLVHRLDEMKVRLLAEVSFVGMGTPDETTYVDASLSELGQHAGDLGAGTVEPFVRIATPVGEVDPCALRQFVEDGEQP